MHGHAKTLGDEAHDGISRHGSAALGKLDHAGVNILHNNTVDTVTILARILGDLGSQHLFGDGALNGTLNFVTNTADGLYSGEATVADGGVHIIPVVESQLPQKNGFQFRIGQGGKGQLQPLHFGFKAAAAVDDIFVPPFFLEPLLDLGSGLVALTDIQPVTAGTLAGFGGDDLHHITVLQGGVDVADPVVNLGTHQSVTHTGVNGIGKVNGGRACRQADDLTLGSKDEDLVVEHIDLQRADVVLGIGVLLAFQQTAHPFKVLFVACAGTLLVFPVGGNAVFGSFVHLPGTDLYLKGDALGADDGGMQTLIHIGLGGGDIVLESPGHQIEQVMDMTQNIVAIGNGIHHHPECVNIVKLVQGLFLGVHFPINGVDVLDSAVGGTVDAHGGKPIGDLVLNGAHKGLILLFMSG